MLCIFDGVRPSVIRQRLKCFSVRPMCRLSASYLRRDRAVRDRWMVGYMDVLTILLIFFVAIADPSTVAPGQEA